MKDLEIPVYKYKQESKVRMQIKNYRFIFPNCVLFEFLNIKKGKIYNENTVVDGIVLREYTPTCRFSIT